MTTIAILYYGDDADSERVAAAIRRAMGDKTWHLATVTVDEPTCAAFNRAVAPFVLPFPDPLVLTADPAIPGRYSVKG